MISLSQYDVFCFDLDGTIYMGNERLPGALELIQYLESKQKQILYISNTSTQTKQDCHKRLNELGISCELDQILTSVSVAASYFVEECTDPVIFTIGERAIQTEFDSYGLKQTVKSEEASHVLVGLDRCFTYEKLNDAVHAVKNGAKLIVTNPDPVCPIPGGFFVDTFAIAKAIEAGAETMIDRIIGKPSIYYGEQLLKQANTTAERCLIIGDRLETDILLGHVNAMDTCLVLTGAANRQQVEETTLKPNVTLDHLHAVLETLQRNELVK